MPSRFARDLVFAVLMSSSLVVPAEAQPRVDRVLTSPIGNDSPPSSRHAMASRAPFVAASLPEDAAWEGFLTPGLSSNGCRFAEYHGKLVIWGDIDAAGSQPAGGVVLWDGSHFEPLPPIGGVDALTIWDDQIIAATMEGTQGAILQFDGARWDTLGAWSGPGWQSANDMTVFEGRLVVVGPFDSIDGVIVNRVAAFDGVTWSGFGSGFPSSEGLHAVVTHAGTLFVGMSNSSQLGYVRRWDPVSNTWQSVGAGLNSFVTDLASNGVDLFASGLFTASGATTINGGGRWDGNAWNSIGLPVAGIVPSVTVWNGKAVFPLQGLSGVGRLKVWDGLTLSTIPGDSLAWSRGYMGVGSLGVNQVGAWGTKLVAWGTFFRNGAAPSPGLAVYDGTQWSSIHETWEPGMRGLIGDATDMRVWSGRLIVSGQVRLAAAENQFRMTPGVAAWDGTQWTELGEGLGGNDIFLGEYNGDLVAAGWRLYPRSNPAVATIARWDGTSWTGFGSNPLYSPTCVQQMHQDLYVGEDFGLYRWNGSTWSQVPRLVDAYALALSITGDSLVVGGSEGGDGSTYVAFWNGTSWLPAGAGVNERVTAVTLWNGRIVIGGMFSASGATPLPGVAVWDGVAWQPLGANSVTIWRLRVIDGELYGTGRFRLPEGSIVETVARYVGPDWQLLGSGSNNIVFEGYQGQLYHGGSGIVHGHVAHNLSRRPLPAPVLAAPPSRPSRVALTLGPNPVQATAHFQFALGSAGRARLTILDVAGREVATVVDGPLGAGPHDLHWAARCAPGIYFARLQANGVDEVVRFARLESE